MKKSPGSTAPNDARFKVAAGEGVKLSGVFNYAGDKTGRYRLDFLQHSDDTPPRLIHTVELKGLGDWTVTAPKNQGDLYIVAFIDQNGDGPSADDPAGMTAKPVTVAEEPISDIVIALSDEPDLGALTPGSGQGGPPPPDGPPPDGPPPDGPPPDGPPPDGPPPDGPAGGAPADGEETSP